MNYHQQKHFLLEPWHGAYQFLVTYKGILCGMLRMNTWRGALTVLAWTLLQDSYLEPMPLNRRWVFFWLATDNSMRGTKNMIRGTSIPPN